VYVSATPRSTLAIAVGTNLRRWRTEHGLTQEQAAERLGRDVSYISTTERGLRNFSLSTVEHLAELLEVEPLWLFRP
jgi:transcriptional regulator with XRE-family HTH domain